MAFTQHRRSSPWRHAAGLLLATLFTAAYGQQPSPTPLFAQPNFSSGTSGFSVKGKVVTDSSGASMAGSLFGVDGALTSQAINVSGYQSLTLSYDRVTHGMNAWPTDSGIVEYAIDGGTFTRLESTRQTTSSRASLTLPSTAGSIVLRFRVVALGTYETFTVNNIVLTGTKSGGGGSAARPPIGKFVTFESGHVRPMALSSDGKRLYAVNTPDNRVEVFDVTGNKPALIESIPVGLEPVAVALLNDKQLWVVNHLSDSVSVVDVSASPARIANTLQVGDEPRDIVFAGTGNRWAFVTAAHRGQNLPIDPKLGTPGTGRADVWVFASDTQGAPATILTMFGDTLRGLARNADGSRVYAAVLNSGNKTTVLEGSPLGGALAKPGPTKAADGTTQPNTNLIVQKNAQGDWVDSGDPKTGTPPKVWNDRVKLNLPDNDVFVIDASAGTPRVTGEYTGVGTTLFNMAVNPRSGKLYVSNQEALNLTRFEGPGTRSTTVRGHFVESRITVIDGTAVSPRHLNKHIASYAQELGTSAEKAASLATPLEMAVTPDGGTLYLAAMGSNKLARLATAALENDSFTPSSASQLVLPGGGPTGVVLDAPRGRAFVTTRLDNGLSVVDTGTFTEVAHVKMYTPEPAEVVSGRRFLYDASYTSSRGDSSCAGCHIFGDMDQLAWDLGDPDGRKVASPNAYNRAIPAFLRKASFHPMKGPMTTQSLRGMAGNGPMHWRGDRTGTTASGDTLEERAFKEFNVAFTGLLGREASLTDDEMTAFARFALQIIYPPNPVRKLDNGLTPVQQQGQTVYNTTLSDGLSTCNGCHTLDPAKGKFGTDNTMSLEGPRLAEDFKIPQLRNMYQKVGMFTRNFPSEQHAGDQIRGFGYENGGAQGRLSTFFKTVVFAAMSEAQRDQIEEFVLAFPSDMNPIVGQQVTVTPANAEQSEVRSRVDLLVQRAQVTSPVPECELVAKGVMGGQSRGWVMNSSLDFLPDRTGDSPQPLAGLLALAKGEGANLTFTCVPPGNGTRIGVNRRSAGVLDRD
jgi:YVTN family beta-propeller protein